MLAVMILGRIILRIVDRTLTMRQEIIMTINVQKTIFRNVFDDPKWPLFDKSRGHSYTDSIPNLGIVEFSSTSGDLGLEQLAVACWSEAAASISFLTKDHYEKLMFVSERYWMPATTDLLRRNTDERRRLNLFKECLRTLGAPVSESTDYVKVDAGEIVRFADLFKIDNENLIGAVHAARINPSYAIICSKRLDIVAKPNIRSIVAAAFPTSDSAQQTSIDWMLLALRVCPLGDLLIRVTGMFDDSEASVEIIANDEIIQIFQN
jgi:hypothetical protein